MILSYLIPGITDGAVYAIAALGLVITYKTSGVFNFAHGAVAAAAAYAFYQFRDKNHMPWPVAAILALIIVGVIGGLILERLAQLLQAAPTVTVVIATVGVLVLLQSLCTAIYGDSQISFDPYLPQGGFHIGKALVSGADMINILIAAGSAGGLFYFFNHNRLGKAMNAVVDDANLLSLQATNPATVRRYAWVMGSSFAALSGELLAPTLGVSVNGLILLVITAYGAAAIGLFDNLPLTVAGGIIIGVLIDTLPDFIQHIHNQIIQQLPGNVPFLILFAVLVFVPGRRLTQRGVRNARRFRPVRSFSPAVMGTGMVAAGILLIILPNVINSARIEQYSSALGYMIIFMSLGIITWTSGQISLCQLAFAAIGATTMGKMLHDGVPWYFALLIAGAITVPAGAIVAIPAIRLSGIYVAVATFGFGILIQQIFYPSFLMFGVLNDVSVPRPHIAGINFTSDKAYYYLALIVVGLMSLLVVTVLRSRLGSLLRALADSPDALDAHGANTTLTRVLIFCISSFMAGIGGAVLAGGPQSASGAKGGTFDFTVSLVFVAVLGFCGRRPLLGPLIAAFLYEVLKIFPFFNGDFWTNYQGVFFGLAAVGVAIYPAINFRATLGQRANEREGSGPIAERFDEQAVRAIQPLSSAQRNPHQGQRAPQGPRQPVGARGNGHAPGTNGHDVNAFPLSKTPRVKAGR